MKFSPRILNHFGIEDAGFYRGPAFVRLYENILEAMRAGLFYVLIGDPGCGKKTAVSEAVRAIYKENERNYNGKHHIVYVQAVDKQRLNIRTVEQAMIYDLSAENPKRDAEARSRQLSRLLGVIVNRLPAERVTVIIEQAHLMHGNTIRAIKQLLELRFLDKAEMFGVILMGHRQLRQKIEGLNDVADRVEFELMSKGIGNEDWQWLNPQDRVDYIKQRWGKALTPTMREHVAAMCRTPLAIDRIIYNKMKEVYERGDAAFGERDFLPLKTEIEQAKLTLDDISKASGVSKATVSLVVNNQYTGSEETAENVRAKIAELTGKRKLQKTG